MFGHGTAGDGAHAAPIGAVEGEEGFAGEAFAEAEEAGVFGQGTATGKETEAERIFETFLNLLG